jgi:hypothetical protein
MSFGCDVVLKKKSLKILVKILENNCEI